MTGGKVTKTNRSVDLFVFVKEKISSTPTCPGVDLEGLTETRHCCYITCSTCSSSFVVEGAIIKSNAQQWWSRKLVPCVGVASGCRLTGSFHWPGLARLRVIRWEEPDLLSLLLKLLMSGTETKVELARSPVCVCVCEGVCVSTHRSLTKRWRCCFMQITFSKHYHQCHINNVVVSLGSKGFQTKTSPGLCVSNRFIFVRCWFTLIWSDFLVFFYPQKRSILSKWTNVQFWWYSNGNQLQFLIWLVSKKNKKLKELF